MSVRIKSSDPPYEPEVDGQLRSMMPPGVEPIALFRTFTKNLAMARAMEPWGRYQLGKSLSVGVRDREIIIDRTCARCGCEYEWGVHVAFFAERASLNPEQVASLAQGRYNDPCWDSERDRLLISLVDALHDEGDIDDTLWSASLGSSMRPNSSTSPCCVGGTTPSVSRLGPPVSPSSLAPRPLLLSATDRCRGTTYANCDPDIRRLQRDRLLDLSLHPQSDAVPRVAGEDRRPNPHRDLHERCRTPNSKSAGIGTERRRCPLREWNRWSWSCDGPGTTRRASFSIPRSNLSVPSARARC